MSTFHESTCPRCNHKFRMVNTKTGDSFEMDCNTYACPVCGPRKIRRLRKAAAKYFSQFSHIRMWTLTLTSNLFEDPVKHYKSLREAWRRFITEIRRNKALSKAQQKFRYFCCLDVHQSGYVHFHVMVDTYIDVHILAGIWNHICNTLTDTEHHVGSVHIKAMPNAKLAAFYVAKYVSKMAKWISYTNRRYSKSNNYRLFPIKNPNKEWMMLRVDICFGEQIDKFLSITPFTCTLNGATSQELAQKALELFQNST